jgi:hypothetical protein
MVLLASVSGCPAQYEYARRAPPIARTVALVESDPRVAAALGGGVSVSLAVARTFDRDFLNAKIRGRDRVMLLTTVRGASGEGWLTVSATNVNEQGWAGTFSLRSEGRQVLREGRYESVGAGEILAGTFAPDGTALVTPTE